MVLRGFLIVLLASVFGSAFAANLDEIDMANPRQPLEAVTTGGQPSIDDLQTFASEGYTLVINLRLPGEFDDFDERKVVENLGMVYVNIPVRGMSALTPEKAALLHQAIESAEGPVLLHCTIGMRVGGLLAVEQYIFHGLSKKEAGALGKKAHMGHIEGAIENSIEKYERNQ